MKTKQFGDFVISSRTRLPLPPKIFQGGPWTHLATVTRSLSEYVALLHEPTQKIYIEQITATGRFVHIEDDKLWYDLVNYLVWKGVLGFNKNDEIIMGEGFDK
tara:strand:+ start:332 stop:640 length:309 start_codon:yes stop_codon:yes gene_type:complete